MKLRPEQQRIRVPFQVVAQGYGGDRAFAGLPGLWRVVAADPEPEQGYRQHPCPSGTIGLIIEPARGGK